MREDSRVAIVAAFVRKLFAELSPVQLLMVRHIINGGRLCEFRESVHILCARSTVERLGGGAAFRRHLEHLAERAGSLRAIVPDIEDILRRGASDSAEDENEHHEGVAEDEQEQ